MKMIERNLTGGDVARAIGVSREAVWWAIYGRLKSKKLREGICRELGLPYSIWDEMDEKVA